MDSPLVVVANRLPVEQMPDGTWQPSPGGLVHTIGPVLAAGGGAWIGWAGQPGSAPPPMRHAGFPLHPVALSTEDIHGYYHGFANSALWPAYHDAIIPPVYRDEDFARYVRVNRRFARAAAAVAPPGAPVWVHDYQLQLVPRMLRALRPDVRIGFFMHIPFPAADIFTSLPPWPALLRGLAGADLVGFQQPTSAENFRSIMDNPRVRVDAFPVSVDVAEIEDLARRPAVRSAARRLRRSLGRPRTVVLAVDRLDYTKGIEQRLDAYADLLAAGELGPPRVCLVQIATPSRDAVPAYAALRRRVERRVAEINRRYPGAVRFVEYAVDRAELVAHYLAADVMAVTPLRDGMNLVAKEYVAARLDGTGALLLSRLAGAAAQLTQAYLIDPGRPAELRGGLLEAIRAHPADRAGRMAAMRAHLREHDVHRWGRDFLAALAGTRAAAGVPAAALSPVEPVALT